MCGRPCRPSPRLGARLCRARAWKLPRPPTLRSGPTPGLWGWQSLSLALCFFRPTPWHEPVLFPGRPLCLACLRQGLPSLVGVLLVFAYVPWPSLGLKAPSSLEQSGAGRTHWEAGRVEGWGLSSHAPACPGLWVGRKSSPRIQAKMWLSFQDAESYLELLPTHPPPEVTHGFSELLSSFKHSTCTLNPTPSHPPWTSLPLFLLHLLPSALYCIFPFTVNARVLPCPRNKQASLTPLLQHLPHLPLLWSQTP